MNKALNISSHYYDLSFTFSAQVKLQVSYMQTCRIFCIKEKTRVHNVCWETPLTIFLIRQKNKYAWYTFFIVTLKWVLECLLVSALVHLYCKSVTHISSAAYKLSIRYIMFFRVNKVPFQLAILFNCSVLFIK